VGLGFGVVNFPVGEAGYLSNLHAIGDNLAPFHASYVSKLEEAVKLEKGAVTELRRGQLEKGKAKLDKAIECLRGTPITPEPPKGQPQYSGGLINMIKAGSLREGTDKDLIVKLLESALKRDLKAKKVLDAKKLKLKRFLKQMIKAGVKKKLAIKLLQLGNKKA
jgi:hypothetical protein